MSAAGEYYSETDKKTKPLRNRQKSQFTYLYRLEKSERQTWVRLSAIMDSLIIPSWNIYFQYGFEVLGPLLFGFGKWLHEIVTAQKIEHLFFLSRDGYLLLNAYEELYSIDPMPVSYLHVSRKAVREAQLWMKPDLCDVSKLFPENIFLEYEEFCGYFNINSAETLGVWEECGLSTKMHFLPKELLKDHRLINFYERIKPRIIEESIKSYTMIIQYLHQNHFTGKIGIVDIGWKGTIQNCLELICQNDTNIGQEITGFYLGLTQEAVQRENRFAFIAAEEEPQEFDAGLVEYPFLAPEGSLLGYTIGTDGFIMPELANYEYDESGHEIVRSMQEGTLHFIKCAKNLVPEDFTWDASFSYANLKRFSKHPTFREVNIFGDLAYYDGGKRLIAAPRSFTHYLLHPKDFPYDLSVSGWRIGFLKRFLKVGINYNKLLKIYKNASRA